MGSAPHSKFHPLITELTPGEASPIIRDYILTALRKKASTAAFRDVDCLQSEPDPTDMAVESLCYTVCTMTCYKDELGSNYSRIAPTNTSNLQFGGAEMLHWIVRNRVWLDKINDQLPTFVTVASVRIGELCNFHKVEEHLSGPLWRVLLLDGGDPSFPVLTPKVDGAELVMPLVTDLELQDCKQQDPTLSYYRTIPRSPLTGFCMYDDLFAWVSATDPNLFPPTDEDPFPIWLVVALAIALVTLCILLLCLWLLLRTCLRRREQKLDDRAAALQQGSHDYTLDDYGFDSTDPVDAQTQARARAKMASLMGSEVASYSAPYNDAMMMSQLSASIPDPLVIDGTVVRDSSFRSRQSNMDDAMMMSHVGRDNLMPTWMNDSSPTQILQGTRYGKSVVGSPMTSHIRQGYVDGAQMMSGIGRDNLDPMPMDSQIRSQAMMNQSMMNSRTGGYHDDAQMMSGIRNDNGEPLYMDPTVQRGRGANQGPGGYTDDAQMMSRIGDDNGDPMFMDPTVQQGPGADQGPGSPLDDAQMMSRVNRDNGDPILLDTALRAPGGAQSSVDFMSQVRSDNLAAMNMDSNIRTQQQYGQFLKVPGTRTPTQMMSAIDYGNPNAMMMDFNNAQMMSHIRNNNPNAMMMDRQQNIRQGAHTPTHMLSGINYSNQDAMMMDSRMAPTQQQQQQRHAKGARGGGWSTPVQMLSAVNYGQPDATMMDPRTRGGMDVHMLSQIRNNNPQQTQMMDPKGKQAPQLRRQQQGQGLKGAKGPGDSVIMLSAMGRDVPDAMMMGNVAGNQRPMQMRTGDHTPVHMLSKINYNNPDAMLMDNRTGRTRPGSPVSGGTNFGTPTSRAPPAGGDVQSGGTPFFRSLIKDDYYDVGYDYGMTMASPRDGIPVGGTVPGSAAGMSEAQWMSLVQNTRMNAIRMNSATRKPVQGQGRNNKNSHGDVHMLSAINNQHPRQAMNMGPTRTQSAGRAEMASRKASSAGNSTVNRRRMSAGDVQWMSQVASGQPQEYLMMDQASSGLPANWGAGHQPPKTAMDSAQKGNALGLSRDDAVWLSQVRSEVPGNVQNMDGFAVGSPVLPPHRQPQMQPRQMSPPRTANPNAGMSVQWMSQIRQGVQQSAEYMDHPASPAHASAPNPAASPKDTPKKSQSVLRRAISTVINMLKLPDARPSSKFTSTASRKESQRAQRPDADFYRGHSGVSAVSVEQHLHLDARRLPASPSASSIALSVHRDSQQQQWHQPQQQQQWQQQQWQQQQWQQQQQPPHRHQLQTDIEYNAPPSRGDSFGKSVTIQESHNESYSPRPVSLQSSTELEPVTMVDVADIAVDMDRSEATN